MPQKPPPARRRVLVVEDNADTRESLSLVLSFSGFEVREAADGADGLRQALEWRPDAVVSDLGMPVMDGWEMARRLRGQLGGSVHLIAVSGFTQGPDRQRSLDAGFDHHLGKPIRPEELIALLGQVA